MQKDAGHFKLNKFMQISTNVFSYMIYIVKYFSNPSFDFVENLITENDVPNITSYQKLSKLSQ